MGGGSCASPRGGADLITPLQGNCWRQQSMRGKAKCKVDDYCQDDRADDSL